MKHQNTKPATNDPLDRLQKSFDHILRTVLSAESIIATIINRQLNEKGIVLTDRQLKQLQKEIKQNKNLNVINFNIDEEAALKCPAHLKGTNTSFSIAIDADKELENFDEKITKTIHELLPQIVAEISTATLETLRTNLKAHQVYNRKQLKPFHKNIEQTWGKPIDLLEMLYCISMEAGDLFNELFRPDAARNNNMVFDVLTRLHARSCQIVTEIILLLRNGYADGAHARWRTLHEITVIGYFIAKQGNDVAERYICHTAVESYKASLIYQIHADALGYDKLSDAEIGCIKDDYEFYIDKYGTNYKNSYGWAAFSLNKDNPTIADIETDVGLKYMRPYYKMASHNVHANPKGIFFRLGLIPEGGDILLAGPSNVGLADPGTCTALSLLQITTNLLTIEEPNLDRVVILQIMAALNEEIKEAFYQSDLQLKENIDT